MPPANTPTAPIDIRTENPRLRPYLEQLEELAGPVPNLAATLTTQSEQDASEENTSFLRLHSSHNLERGENFSDGSRPPYLNNTDFTQPRTRNDRGQGRNQRSGPLNFWRHSPTLLHGYDQVNASDSRRRGGYNGWAPGTSDTEGNNPYRVLDGPGALAREATNGTRISNEEQEIENLTWELWNTPEPGQTRRNINRSLNWAHPREQSNSVENSSIRFNTTEPSFRTAALLQSVRRHSRLSPRSHSHLENYILERNRPSQDHDPRPRSSIRQSAETHSPVFIANPLQSEGRTRYCQTSGSRSLEAAIKYLERLRFCDTYSERVSSAAASGFVCAEFLADNKDFITDTNAIDPPLPTSWLKPGGVFSGSQHATGVPSLPLYQITQQPTQIPQDYRGNQNTDGSSRSSMVQRSWVNYMAAQAPENMRSFSHDSEDSWPVKVTINGIDFENMTLSGTMEASNVPKKSVPPQRSSITTFLEGEIIDFNKHTLETKSFKAGTSIDSTYWRRLEPFRSLSEKEIVSNLVSVKWLKEELGKKWILMRWKERCFISPSDAESGLTISGFYYVSLKRDDGHIEGLYYDPSATPYQHLSLFPEKRVFPAYSFQ